jgi:hypothetical protein
VSWHKFRAKKTTFENQTFPSRLEANVYAHFKLLEKAGEVSGVERHPTYTLSEAKLRYKCDMKAVDKNGFEFAIEAKGVVTDRWRIIKKLWKTFGPYRLEVWRAKGRGVYLAETIEVER